MRSDNPHWLEYGSRCFAEGHDDSIDVGWSDKLARARIEPCGPLRPPRALFLRCLDQPGAGSPQSLFNHVAAALSGKGLAYLHVKARQTGCSTTTSRCFVCCITAAVASITVSSPLSMERLETGPFQENPSLALVFDRRLLQQNLPKADIARRRALYLLRPSFWWSIAKLRVLLVPVLACARTSAPVAR